MDKEKTVLQNIRNDFPLKMPTPDEMISRVQYLRDKENKKKTNKNH